MTRWLALVVLVLAGVAALVLYWTGSVPSVNLLAAQAGFLGVGAALTVSRGLRERAAVVAQAIARYEFDPAAFGTLMAIAEHESSFVPTVVNPKEAA